MAPSSTSRHRSIRARPQLELKTEARKRAIFGGNATKAAFAGFLGIWRNLYEKGDGIVPTLEPDDLPVAFQDIAPQVVMSAGGAAEGGVVSEGIGYGIMLEGVLAGAGHEAGKENGLALMRAWLGMVDGPRHTLKVPKEGATRVQHPLGGGKGSDAGTATNVSLPPYGVSAILPQGSVARGPSGVAAWKFPLDACSWGLCLGSATDADEDAVFGMIYLAAALDFPDDFTDTVIRAVISLASADLGFPDLFRTLPDGTKVFVPKGGSEWGGLTPPSGPYKSSFNAGCVNPSYFSPGSYRLFRDFATAKWKSSFDQYLPPHMDGRKSTLTELVEAFDGAVIASYNILYRSTCSSGAVSNWAGSQADCDDKSALSCSGVPWAFTPHVGEDGTCSGSGTSWGSWGKDACRAPWRIALDYVLYPEESVSVKMYDASGQEDSSIEFNAQVYLNRIAKQYVQYSLCDGGTPVDCRKEGRTDAVKLAPAFVPGSGSPGLTCDNVPKAPKPNWWAAEMSHPTFAGFVAPLASLDVGQSIAWLNTLASICDFSDIANYDDMDTEHGVDDLCSKTYFQASQQVISAMITSGTLRKLPLTDSH